MTGATLTVTPEDITRFLANVPGATMEEVEQWKSDGEIVIVDQRKACENENGNPKN